MLERLDKSGFAEEWISFCKRCLQPRKEDRFTNAQELAEHCVVLLTAWNERDHNTKIEQVRSNEVHKRSSLKRALIVSSVSLGVIAFSSLLFLRSWWIAATARDRVARIEYGRSIQNAHQAWLEDRADEASNMLSGTDPQFRGWEGDYVHRLCNGQILEVNGVHAENLSLDGTRLFAVRSNSLATFNVASGERLSHCWIDHQVNFERVCNSALMAIRYLTANINGTAQVWDTTDGKEIFRNQSPNRGYHALLSPDGNRVFRLDRKSVLVWDVKTGARIAELVGHEPYAANVISNHDGRRVITNSFNGNFRLWDLSVTPPVATTITGKMNKIQDAILSIEGVTLAVTELAGEVSLLDLRAKNYQEVSKHVKMVLGRKHLRLVVRAIRSLELGLTITYVFGKRVKVCDGEPYSNSLDYPVS